MFRISPSQKESASAAAAAAAAATRKPTTFAHPVEIWTTQRRFQFPPALSIYENALLIDNTRFRVIDEVPHPTTPLYQQLSQYNPWLDCEMTREKREYLTPCAGELCCPTYIFYNSTPFFRNETIVDIVNLYLWPLLYSRSDDVIACGTFAEWRRLFKHTISLAFPGYEYWQSVVSSVNEGMLNAFVSVSDQRRTAQILKYMTPARVLYLLTTRANFWPYGGAPETRSTQQYGICSVKPKIKEYTDKTKIEWLVSADFLRKMKRVHIYFTPALSSTTTVAALSVYDTDEE
jgi:hypothetical protein